MKKHITYMILCMLSAACSRTATTPEYGMVSIAFTPGILHTKTYDPEENKISDLNVFIFDENGILEESRYLQHSGLQIDGNTVFCNIRCVLNTELQVFACANVGFRINDINDIDDLNKFRYYMSYPDEYSRGIPMSGSSGKVKVSNEKNSIVVKMERLMSRISVSVDRRALKKNVRFNVRSIRIGGCPKSANMFARSKAEGKGDTFGQGFMKRYAETDDLNIDETAGVSREVDVYMLENMQGNLLPSAKTEADKVLDLSDALSEVCSYIEMKIEYKSDSLYSRPEEYLTYRFYLGDSPSNFDVERNCHYHLTVKPIGAGVPESSWRVDKSGLAAYGTTSIKLHPGNYIEGKVGDKVHLWAETDPAGARLTFGEEELEYDKSRGLYDYTMDRDGHGVTLHLKNKGSGIVYIEAGAPVSDAAMAVIVIN